MLTRKKTNFLTALSLIIVSATCFAFTVRNGGEGYEIYLDNKVVLQQYGKQMDEVKNLPLTNAYANTSLAIRYFHCGKNGTGRTVSIRNQKNIVLKQWRYGDTGVMLTCNVNDITGLQNTVNGPLQLFYTSNELPAGRTLAIITGE